MEDARRVRVKLKERVTRGEFEQWWLERRDGSRDAIDRRWRRRWLEQRGEECARCGWRRAEALIEDVGQKAGGRTPRTAQRPHSARAPFPRTGHSVHKL